MWQKTDEIAARYLAAYAVLTNASRRYANVVRAVHRVYRRESHADAQECRAKVAVKV
jgi:hypothetical protein